MGVLCPFAVRTISMVDIPHRQKFSAKGVFVSVTTMREVFCGAISQGIAPYFLWKT